MVSNYDWLIRAALRAHIPLAVLFEVTHRCDPGLRARGLRAPATPGKFSVQGEQGSEDDEHNGDGARWAGDRGLGNGAAAAVHDVAFLQKLTLVEDEPVGSPSRKSTAHPNGGARRYLRVRCAPGKYVHSFPVFEFHSQQFI